MRDKKSPAESSSTEQPPLVKYITAHALERWIERTDCTTKAQARAQLKKLVAKATEVELAPRYQALALLNHDFKPARYLKFEKWIFVISEEGGLMTIHSGTA